MKAYINGTGIISPQNTWDNSEFLKESRNYSSRMIQCLEPEVDPGLDEKYLRRMSRMIRLGWLASKICLDDVGNVSPDAIITGSGWGSIMDSERFLLSIYRNKESLLPPTPFIQSTHNAVGAQVAMLLNNYEYNMAYAHSSFAFEHALLDGLISIGSGERRNILLGGFDEITANQFTLIGRIRQWRREAVNSLDMIEHKGKGTIAGEGFNFFFLQDHPAENSYAVVQDVMTMFSEKNTDQISKRALSWLTKHGLEPEAVDWVFAGLNGDQYGDKIYEDVLSEIFPGKINLAAWKHLSGEYLTSSAFATWAASKVIKHQAIPGIFIKKNNKKNKAIEKVLVYNHFKGIHHSFILLSKIG